MSQQIKSIIVGVFSGVGTYFAAVFALARTNAITMPRDFSLAVWDALVVFGLGATLVALLIHSIALTVTKSNRTASLAGFALSFIACLAISGLLQTGLKALLAVLIGAALATLVVGLRSNNSFKPTPLRGAA